MINDTFTVYTTPLTSYCTDPPGFFTTNICCDTANLGTTNQFKLSSYSYTFGITIINSHVRLLGFADTATEFRYEQLQAALGITPGSPFLLRDSNVVTDESLPLLRFFIGMFCCYRDLWQLQ